LLEGKKSENILSIYDHSSLWLFIGLFSAQENKQVHIFTDLPEDFLQRLKEDEGQLRKNVTLHKTSDVCGFSISGCLNPWTASFNNQDVITIFEQQQLQAILKKFIKQIVTSKAPNNLDKLIHISHNLVRAHLMTI